MYISKISSYLKYKNFTQNKTIFYKNTKIKSYQIDDEVDFKIVSFLARDYFLKSS